jgi:F-type H+-transporting ATPase subunit b
MLKRLMMTAVLALSLALMARPVLAQEDHPAPAAAGAAAAEHSAHSVGEAAAPGEHHGEHEKPPLLPKLDDPGTWWSALWVVIIFVILLAVLYPTAWKNVLAGLKAREERIRKDIADAEASRARAEATLKDYNGQLAAAEKRVQEMLSKAVIDGEKLATNIKMSAQKEAEEAKERATREIESAKNQALAEVYEQTANLATSVAEKILRRNLNADDQKDLVRTSLDQMQTIGRG